MGDGKGFRCPLRNNNTHGAPQTSFISHLRTKRRDEPRACWRSTGGVAHAQHISVMSEDLLFRAAGLVALLSYLLPMAVKMRPRTARAFHAGALTIIGATIVAAIALWLTPF